MKGASVENVWHGTMKHDIVRPNGEIAVKASGRSFDTHVNMVSEMSEEGLITRINEF